MNQMKAHYQWNSRPADERFWTLADLQSAVFEHRKAAATALVEPEDLRVEAIDGDVQLIGKTGTTARLTSYAFGQLSARAKAPAAYLQDLPATLAVQNLNYGLKAHAEGREKTSLLLHRNGGYFARAVLSDRYTRIWNTDVVSRLMPLADAGWTNPPAFVPWNPDLGPMPTRVATEDDAKLSLSVRPGDLIAPAGLYASFEDMFVFLVNPDRIIRDGSPEGLMRGVMLWNSEVGKSSFGVRTFLFRGVCGNHIIWDSTNVHELKIRHIGNADAQVFGQLEIELTKYADKSATVDEAMIESAKRFTLGASKDEVLDFVFAQKFLSRKTAELAYDAALPDVDGSPNTAWGFAQGATRYSQTLTNADDRVALDRAAGKVLEVAF